MAIPFNIRDLIFHSATKRHVLRSLHSITFMLIAGLAQTCSLLRFRKPYYRLIAHLIDKTGLFDEEYYLNNNLDVQASGKSALWHFVRHGDREGRSPMPVFEPNHYRKHLRSSLDKRINSLIHYSLIGRHYDMSPSIWFDPGYYLTENRDVKFSGADPLKHFLEQGGREGRSPSTLFNADAYRKNYPDVAQSGINPLIHYLKAGRQEGRIASRSTASAIPVSPMISTAAPTEEEWNSLEPSPSSKAPSVDVIVPVYTGTAETLRCIYNILKYSQSTPFELTVINDSSPDENLVQQLRTLAGRGLYTFLENPVNKGFVHTANRGLSLHAERDVVLVNADAEVFNDWLDRLKSAAYSSPKIATVTPLSNNATICSYPKFNTDNPFPLEIDYEKLDRLATIANQHLQPIEAPTAVGFCMYIRRGALDEVGCFDERAFGSGYGEENDLCQRLIRHGWINVIAPNILVRHWGSTSFKGRRVARIQKAMAIIAKRYPSYHQDIQDFVAKDPLSAARKQLDEARLMNLASPMGNVLIVSHNRGGGTERFLQKQTRQLSLQGKSVFFLRPALAKQDPGCAQLTHFSTFQLPNLLPIDLSTPESLSRMLTTLEISEIHIHQLVDFPEGAPVTLARIAKNHSVRTIVYIHDYHSICPGINLIDNSRTYCGEPDAEGCNYCLSEKSAKSRTTNCSDITLWRTRYRSLMETADSIIVPDEDVAKRLKSYFHIDTIQVEPHDNFSTSIITPNSEPILPEDKLRIVIIGAIGYPKGYNILAACARDANKRKLPLEFTVMGFTQSDRTLQQLGVRITGKYLEHNANQLLSELSPHIVWLPSVWPETFSYTLSIALANTYKVAAFDIGAIANRIRQAGMGRLLHPIDWAQKPVKVNNSFMEYREGIILRGQQSHGNNSIAQ